MAYGNIKADNLIYDNSGTDTTVSVSALAGAGSAAGTGSANTFTATQTFNGGINVSAEAVSALDIDLSTGNYFTKSISTSSTVTFSNPPASGTVGSFILQLTLTGTGTTITWPNGTGGQGTVYWNGDAGTTAPTLTDARTHIFLFVTSDGGTTYRGAVLKDYTN
jgi:hypothetical protein|tara:strand:- start:3954 stop:4445 length:492 start_codon:yes stop_codon:yes gene_type:complete